MPPTPTTQARFQALLCLAAALLSFASAQNQTLGLEAALAQLPNGPEYALAALNLQSATTQLENARATLGPSLSAGGRYDLGTNTTTTTQSANLSANASLPVLPWAQAYDALRQAERAHARALLDHQDAMAQAKLNLYKQYSDWRMAQQSLGYANANHNLAMALLEVAQKQLSAGQITQDAQNNRRIATENTTLARLQAQNTLDIATRQLAYSLQSNIAGFVASTPAPNTMPAAALETLLPTCLAKRSDIQKAQSRLEDAADNLRNAERDRAVPNANLSVGYTIEGGPTVSGGLNVSNGTASAGLSYPVLGGNNNAGLTVSATLSVPILDPSKDAQINTAKINLEIAKQNLAQTMQSAEIDLRGKHQDWLLNNSRVEVARLGVQQAQNNQDVAKARQNAGLISVLDVQSSALSLQNAEVNLETNQWNAHLAQRRFDFACGTLQTTTAQTTQTEGEKK